MFAPGYALGTLPFLVIAICPLSRVLMMTMMNVDRTERPGPTEADLPTGSSRAPVSSTRRRRGGSQADPSRLIGVPTTYFIAQDGQIHATKIGEISEQDLENHMQSLLSTQALDPGAAERTRSMESSR